MDEFEFAKDYKELIEKYQDLIEKYQQISNSYQGVAVPHRGVCDEIKKIVMCISNSLYMNDPKINFELIRAFSAYSFVDSIKIDGNSCSISFYDEGILRSINFKCVFFDEEYKKMCYTTDELLEKGASVKRIQNLVGRYKYSSQCHFVSLEYLKKSKDKNIRAITSICNSTQGVSFFHSYIYNCKNNMVYDLSRNIMMDKYDFDYLFTLYEINSLSYTDYLHCSDVVDNDLFQKLFVIALKKLNDDSNNDFKKKIGHI